MRLAKLTPSPSRSDSLPNPDSRLTDLYRPESPPPRTLQRNLRCCTKRRGNPQQPLFEVANRFTAFSVRTPWRLTGQFLFRWPWQPDRAGAGKQTGRRKQGDGEVSEKSLENEAISGFPVLGKGSAGPLRSPSASLGMERMRKTAPMEGIGSILAAGRKPKWKFWLIPEENC